MVYNFVSVAFRANTCFGILVQKFCDQIFNFLCHWNLVPHWVRKYDRSRFYQIGQFALIWVHERWSASNHLINQDPQSPPIYWEVMARVLNNFGRKVLCCAAKRLSLLILIQVFCQSEVSQFNIPILLHKHIFWLQVSMHDFVRV